MRTPIRDPEKQPTETEFEGLRAHVSLYSELTRIETIQDEVKAAIRQEIQDGTLIQPEILANKRRFVLSQLGGIRNTIVVSNNEREEKEGITQSGDDDIGGISPCRSVASLNSIARNHNYVS